MRRRGRRTCCRSAVLTLLATSIAWSGPAGADDPRDEARRHAQAAEQAVAAGDFATALREYEVARALYPNPLIELNIAQALAELGRPASAIEALESVIRAEGVPEPRREEARAEVARLRERAARVSITVDVAGATIRIGDRTVCHSPCAGPILADPGRVVVEATRDGFEPARQVVELGPSSVSSLSLALRPVPRSTRDAPQLEVRRVGPPPRRAPAPRGRTVAWVTGGAAVALSIGGAVLGSLALARHGELEDQDQDQPAGWERAHELAGEVRTLRTATDVALGAALVSAAICVISLVDGATDHDGRP